MNDKFGQVKGLMATMSAIYSDAVDRAQSRWHASENIIPSSTCAASTVREVNLELNGKLTGMVFRVQTADVSVGDLRCRLLEAQAREDGGLSQDHQDCGGGPDGGHRLNPIPTTNPPCIGLNTYFHEDPVEIQRW